MRSNQSPWLGSSAVAHRGPTRTHKVQRGRCKTPLAASYSRKLRAIIVIYCDRSPLFKGPILLITGIAFLVPAHNNAFPFTLIVKIP